MKERNEERNEETKEMRKGMEGIQEGRKDLFAWLRCILIVEALDNDISDPLVCVGEGKDSTGSLDH